MTEKVVYPIPIFKKLKKWGYEKSLKVDPLYAEDFIKQQQSNRIFLKGQIFSAKACLRIKLFSPQNCMKEYIIFELYLSQNIDQN